MYLSIFESSGAGYLSVLDLSKNHFELFDLPVTFAVDTKRLAERYRILQAATHPGRCPVVLKDEMPSFACSRVDEAYRILKDPLARAKYLLCLLTGDSAIDSSKGATFLMEQMELREVLAQAQHGSNRRGAVANVMTELAERSLALDKELQGLFADPSAENLEIARELVRELQFLDHCRGDAAYFEIATDSET